PWGCAFELGKVVESWEKWRVMWRKAGKWSSGGKNAGGKRGYWMNSASCLNGREDDTIWPKPDREAMWVHCQMHYSRMGHTITNRGLAAIGTAGLVVGQCLGRGNTTIPIRGDYLIGLGVRSTIAAGLAGGSVATGTITIPEVIDDCGSVSSSLLSVRYGDIQSSMTSATDNSFTLGSTKEAENVKILQSCNGLLLYRVDIDDFMMPLPEGWSIRSTVWRIVLGEREDDSLLVINLSGKVVQYNLISKMLYDIFYYGSNQLDDNHDDDNDDDDDELLQKLNMTFMSSLFLLQEAFIRGSLKRVMIRAFIRGMVTFEALDELMEITSSTELHNRMRFWFVQEIAEEKGLLKFLRERCDDLRRKITKRCVLIREMEALEDRRVVVDSLESLKQTHAREN
nr:hypothetical protein [Tanacetum cinerariifolium]